MSRLKKREVWKIHPEFTNYEVSDQGKVRRRIGGSNTKAKRVLKPFLLKKGYLSIQLSKNKKRKFYLVHRLVLETFISFCPEKHQCNHKDGVKINNFLLNLEWITPSENQIHAYKTGLKSSLKGENRWNSKLKEGEVWLIRKLLSHRVPQWLIAEMFKVHQFTISKIKRGVTWK